VLIIGKRCDCSLRYLRADISAIGPKELIYGTGSTTPFSIICCQIDFFSLYSAVSWKWRSGGPSHLSAGSAVPSRNLYPSSVVFHQTPLPGKRYGYNLRRCACQLLMQLVLPCLKSKKYIYIVITVLGCLLLAVFTKSFACPNTLHVQCCWT